jgi:hypothetical protein
MKEHKKHGQHPHDKIAAVPQFKEGHWENKMQKPSVAEGKYSSEMNQAEEYKQQTNGLANYAKKHKMKH